MYIVKVIRKFDKKSPAEYTEITSDQPTAKKAAREVLKGCRRDCYKVAFVSVRCV